MHSRQILVVALAMAAVLPGCGGSTAKGTSGTTTLAAVTTTTVPPPTLAPTTTLPPKATVGFPSTYEAANHLVGACEAHDRASAARGADAEAVTGIFATPDSPMENRGCTSDDTLPEGGCIFRTDTGLVQINTEKRPIGWVVASAAYEPF